MALNKYSGSEILNEMRIFYGEQCCKYHLSFDESLDLLMGFAEAWVTMLAMIASEEDGEDVSKIQGKFVSVTRIPDDEPLMEVPDNIAELEDMDL